MMQTIRPIAIYLPQFHPIPENDQWWGKGFTEWTNVAKARPLFKGQYQPHLPSDLGFYDLRIPEVREQQAEMARAHGIHGFCYYHYWFNGKRLLERPFQEVFESGKPNFPFMLCWANENWTRKWDGRDKEILMKQEYSFEDDRNHIRYLLPYFKDERYIKVDGKPVFIIYRSALFPDITKTITVFREEAAKHGVSLYICRMESFDKGKELIEHGFDAAVSFEPFTNFGEFHHDQWRKKKSAVVSRWDNSIKKLQHQYLKKRAEYMGHLYDYNDFVNWVIQHYRQPDDYKQYPGITPSWDNSARIQQDYLIFKNATPAKYQEWLSHIIKKFQPYSTEENFLFINAWNEWAEGNHLEPCARWGREYLERTKQALQVSQKLG